MFFPSQPPNDEHFFIVLVACLRKGIEAWSLFIGEPSNSLVIVVALSMEGFNNFSLRKIHRFDLLEHTLVVGGRWFAIVFDDRLVVTDDGIGDSTG